MHTQSPSPDTTKSTRSAIWCGILLLSLYLLTTGGQTFISDGEIMALTAVRLIDSQTLSLPETATAFPQVVRGYEGQVVSRYGIGQPLVAALFYWTGRYIISWYMIPGSDDFRVGTFCMLQVPACATALTSGLLSAWATQLYRSVHVGILIALLYGIGTLAWPYSRFFFSEPLATACLVCCAYALYRKHPSLAGLAYGYAIATRLGCLVLAPIFVIYAHLRGYTWRSIVHMGAGVLPGCILIVLNNWLRFHSLLEHGYAADDGFTGNLFVGLYGLLLSPGKSVFLYVPILLAFPVALVSFFRSHKPEALLIIGLICLTLVQNSLWWMWWAGWGWGPRFLVPLMPFCLLALGPLFNQQTWRRVLLFVLFPLSIGVNMLGILVDFNTYLSDITRGERERELIYLFDPAYSPVLAHVKRLDWSHIPIVSFQLDHPNIGFPHVIAQLISISFIILLVIALARLWIMVRATSRAPIQCD